MTPSQKRRFRFLCSRMADLINELHEGPHPEAVLFIEEGSVSIYDWPPEMEKRPDFPLCDGGAYWHKAGGGGR